jgi:hypothetical protein
MADLIPQLESTLPKVLGEAGEEVSSRTIEFFTAEIRNENTRKAYARAVRRFFRWAAGRSLDLSDIEPPHVAAYVEEDDRADRKVEPGGSREARRRPTISSGGRGIAQQFWAGPFISSLFDVSRWAEGLHSVRVLRYGLPRKLKPTPRAHTVRHCGATEPTAIYRRGRPPRCRSTPRGPRPSAPA